MNSTNMQQQFKSFKLSLEQGVASLVFAKPEKANAMSKDFWEEFPRAIEALEAEPELRALIISGEGKHFSSGMDLSVFANNESLKNKSARERERLRRLILNLQDAFTKLERLRFPVIAAIHGACVGAALDLAAACDLRYAAKNAIFCIQEINLAMMADLGVLQRLPRIIPEGVVRELAFTGDRFGADRAYKLGLLNAVFEQESEMMSEVHAVAKKITAKSPLAIAATKEALNAARDNSLQSSLAQAALLQSALLDLEDLETAASAGNRDSEFAPLLASSVI